MSEAARTSNSYASHVGETEHTRYAAVKSIDTATGEAAPAEVSENRVKQIFGEIANRYDLFNALSSFGRYKSWLRTLVSLSPINERSHVLDVAGGTGDVTFAVCNRKPPRSVLLTDLTPEMLDVARDRLREGASCGVPVDTAVVDAQDIPYASESFDVVTMAYGIRNIPRREQALHEIYRVLKPGGSVCILEFSTPPNPIMRALYHAYLRVGIPFWGNLVTGKREDFVYLSRSISAFPDQKTFADMLYSAGFSHVEYRNVTFGVAAIHIARK